MTASVLYVLGTPAGRWVDWAGACLDPTAFGRKFELAAAAAERVARGIDEGGTDRGELRFDAAELAAWLPPDGETGLWGGICRDGCWAVDVLAGRVPQAFFVVWVESPEAGLAAALACGEAPDAGRWLASWRAGSRRLLRLVQSHRSRCVLLDAAEAQRDPVAAWAALAGRLNIELLAAPDVPSAPGDGLLSDAVAAMLTAGRPELEALHRELIASCEVPITDAPLAPRAAQSARLVSEFQALRAAAKGHAKAAHQLEAAQSRLAELQVQADAALVQLTESTAGLALANDQLARLKREAAEREAAARAEAQRFGLALEAASQAQTTLQAEHDALREQALQDGIALRQAQASLQASEAERDTAREGLATLQQEGAQLAARLQATQETLARLQRDAAAAEAHATAMQTEQHGLLQRADAARHEAASLLAQLHEAQEALEVVDARRRKLEATQRQAPDAPAAPPKPVAAPRLPSGDFDIGEGRLLSADVEPPFRQISLSLRRIKAPGREVGEAMVRLVEHNGHPGLVLFGGKGQTPLLATWRESGVEEGRPYQLLVPSDAACQPVFDAMGSDDWQLTLALADAIERELRAAPGAKRELWIGLAQRLRQQLLELPRRFRYSALTVQALDGGTPGGLALRFARVHWGLREVRGLTVHWRPGATEGTLALVHTEGRSPLLSWPAGDDGMPPPQLTLPISRHAPAADRQLWERLPRSDREFVVALLAAWPQAVADPAFAALPAGMTGKALATAADALRRDALQTLAPAIDGLGLVGLLRRAARRLQKRP